MDLLVVFQFLDDFYGVGADVAIVVDEQAGLATLAERRLAAKAQ